MKSSYISVIAVLLVVIAVAVSGCSSSPTTTPAGSAAPAEAGAGGPAAQQQGSGSAAAPAAAEPAAASSGSAVTGSSLFGGLSYNWVEYKMIGGETGGEQMTIYYKYNKQTGKCSMRFEGEGAAELAQMGMTEMDCTPSGNGASTSDPNTETSNVQFSKVGTEIITVPAGTFTADKYVATSEGVTSTYWIANGKPLLKMQGGDATGSVVMELNGMG
jgi:hypothetical protein